MKWGASRRLGDKLRRSWVPILLVVAVGLSALAGGPSGRIPVASATTPWGYVATFIVSTTSGGLSQPVLRLTLVNSSGAGIAVATSTVVRNVTFTQTGFSASSGYNADSQYASYAYSDYLITSVNNGYVTGTSLAGWTCTYSIQTSWGVASGTLTTAAISSWGSSKNVSTAPTAWGPIPLSVSITGPGVVNTDDVHTWTATGSGGTGPYTYAWTYGATGPFFTYPYSGASFSSKLAQGTWTLECRVTDSTGATAISDLQVIASPGFSGAGYQITLTRSGAAGTELTADARNVVNGLVAAISNSASSKVAWYTSTVPSTFTWYNLMAEGSSGTAFSWLWSLIVAGTPPIPAPPDTWFSSVITVNGIQMTVVHHFVHINEVATLWFDSAGNCLNPETPPASGYQPPDWLKPLIDFLTFLFAPVIFVFEVIKSVINFAVGLIAYVSYVMGVVLSFAGLMAQWLYVAVTTVFNFASASPGAYVSIGGLLSLAGFTDTGITGDTSIFKGVGISASAMDVGLSKIHDWIMSPSVAWLWWAIFTFLLIRLVLNLGGGEEGGDE